MPRNIFDNIASDYDNTFPEHITNHYVEKRVHFLSRYLKKNSRILDVGCGTGRLITNLPPSNGLTVYGCDISIEMLKNTRLRDFRISCCLSDYLPYKDSAFDMVISAAVFHHLNSLEVALRTIDEMLRVTRKGGRVIIWDANQLNPYWLFLFKRVPHDKDVKAFMPLKEIIIRAKAYNLAKIELFKNGWIPDFVPQRLLFFLKPLEYILEHTPVIKLFSAHNVVLITK